jgi:DNA-binding response OmpR family regulator
VLLVDDEPAVLRLGRTVLRHHGYEVLLAADGARAVDLYRRRERCIALVILDVVLPRLSGRDALRRLRQIDPDVRALLISGYPAGQGGAVDTPGVCGFLAKPFRGQDLVAVVRAAMDRGQPGSSMGSAGRT